VLLTLNRGTELFTPLERKSVLKKLIAGFKNDERIIGIVLVGSGAVGFKDKFSDIDIIAVADPQYPTRKVFQETVQRLRDELSIIHQFEVSFSENSFLAGCLLANCLEVDCGVVSTDELTAKKENWQVVYDRTGELEVKLQASWAIKEKVNPQEVGKRFSSVWHYIIQAVVSIQRRQLWRAMHNLEEIRNRGLNLVGLRYGLIVSHFRQIDELPQDELKLFEQTLVRSVTRGEIMHALQAAVDCFFREMRLIEQGNSNLEITEAIEREMKRLLEESV
jgi:predicted nucleotidyltransferase